MVWSWIVTCEITLKYVVKTERQKENLAETQLYLANGTLSLSKNKQKHRKVWITLNNWNKYIWMTENIYIDYKDIPFPSQESKGHFERWTIH